MIVKPTQPDGRYYLVCRNRKKLRFQHTTPRLTAADYSSPHREGTRCRQTFEAVCSTAKSALAAMFEGRGRCVNGVLVRDVRA